MSDDRTVQLTEEDIKNLSTDPVRPVTNGTDHTRMFMQTKLDLDALLWEKQTKAGASLDTPGKLNELNLADLHEAYVIEDVVAEGGQGIIKSGRDRVLKRLVAVKSLRNELLVNEDLVTGFVTEAQITAQLDHPSIIPLYGLRTDDDHGLHLAMKMVNGLPLDEYLKGTVKLYLEKGIQAFDEPSALVNRLEHFLKVCEGLSYAHSQGIIHRDIKPENIMVGQFHEVYVMDWGISTAYDGKRKRSLADGLHITGTPAYLAPELIEKKIYNFQTDIFALGMVLFELVTLKKAVKGATPFEMLYKIKKGDFESLEHTFPSIKIPADLEAIIRKALALDPAHRYKSVNGLARDLRRFLIGEEVSARPDNGFRRAMRWIINHKQMTAIIVMSVLLLFAGVTTLSLYNQNRLIKESQRRELLLTAFQHETAQKAHYFDRFFLHLRDMLYSIGGRANYELYMNKEIDADQAFYTNQDFMTKGKGPADLAYSPLYKKDVSIDYPVFVLSPGVVQKDVQKDIYRMNSIRFPLQDFLLYGSSPDVPVGTTRKALKEQLLNEGFSVRWIYLGLENGLFMSYPGKGGYKPDYDPRKRPWYKEAVGKKGVHWGMPYLDISGQGLVMPGVLPLRGEDGKLQGVLGLDVKFGYIRDRFASLFPHRLESRKFLLDGEGHVVLSTDYLKAPLDDVLTKDKSVRSAPFPYTDVLKEILNKKGGQVQAEIDGEDYVIAFSPVMTLGWFYVEMVPEDEIID